MSKLFEGQTIYLRPVLPTDADLYYEFSLNADVRHLTGTQPVFNRAFVRNYLERKTQSPNEILSFIILKDTNEVIGDIQLNDIDDMNRSANIRIAINDKIHQGKGYGREAMLLVMDYGFGVMNLHRIDLSVYAFNENAIKAYETLGFKKEGVKRDVLFYNHQYHDSYIMSILEDEYRELHL